MANDDIVAQQILEYLHEHPHACDTLEGIARWWVMRQRLNESVDVIQRALERLKTEGVIEEHKGPDRRTLYSLSDRK